MSSIIEKMMPMIVGVAVIAAATGNIDELQIWIWKAQAKVIQESRTSNWGSPRFFLAGNLSQISSVKSQNRSFKTPLKDL